ncbi:hypothetical protein Bbelb_196990 [Branchiostoma belcheri]|nr:hypothetical protein Bbelb_196990 [Branchiostoma belcheri]
MLTDSTGVEYGKNKPIGMGVQFCCPKTMLNRKDAHSWSATDGHIQGQLGGAVPGRSGVCVDNTALALPYIPRQDLLYPEPCFIQNHAQSRFWIVDLYPEPCFIQNHAQARFWIVDAYPEPYYVHGSAETIQDRA